MQSLRGAGDIAFGEQRFQRHQQIQIDAA